MSVTQTVEVPDSHRLTIDVPREIPAGPVILTFTPKTAESSHSITARKAMAGLDLGSSLPFDPVKAMEAIERCSGLAKRLGINLSVDEFLEMCRQDKELEDRLDQ
jgi:hypothetical protein